MQKAVIHRIATITCRSDEGLEIDTSAALPDEIGKPFGTERGIPAFLRLAADQPVFAVIHLPSPIYWPSS